VGGDDLDPTTSYVVVPNHLSNYDIMICFLAVPVPIRFLAKKELFKYPLLSHAMRAIGCVEVDRAAHSQAVAAINEQAALVRSRNHSLLIYAEGTRSRDGELKSFKKGAFAIASGSGLPIVPVGIIGSRDVVPPGTIKVNRHQTVTVRIGSPIIDTAGRPVTDLRDETHAAVEALISQA
jgi:1-acyl-sn-glycerol-3-phosphate acyltransferase